MINFCHSQNLSKKKKRVKALPGAGFLASAKGGAQYGTNAIGNKKLVYVSVSGHRAGAPNSMPVNAIRTATPFPSCRAIKKASRFRFLPWSFLSSWLLVSWGRSSGPFAPFIKSLPSGKEILLFERGNRASYKISRLEVIFMGPRAGRFLVLFCAQKSTNKTSDLGDFPGHRAGAFRSDAP